VTSKSGIYRFTAPPEGSVERFLSRNRVSTDALNALGHWRSGAPSRDFEVVQDEDECLVATLTFDGADQRAGLSLDAHVARFGVAVEFVGLP
jgi:hypothetical protein